MSLALRPMARNVERLICSSPRGRFFTQQFLDRAVKIGHRECRSDWTTDWESSGTKSESTSPRSPGHVVQLLLQDGVGAVWIYPHLERDVSFFIRVTDRVVHPAAVAQVIVPALPDVLARLFVAHQKFHGSFWNIGNRLRRIPGDALGRVERAFCRSDE